MSPIDTKQSAENDMIDYTTHNMEKKGIRTKREKLWNYGEHIFWNNRGEYTCLNLYRVINEDIRKPSISG